MKSFFEFVGLLATALLTGFAFFLYLGHAKNLSKTGPASAAHYRDSDSLEGEPAAEISRQPAAKKRSQVPDYERVASYPAGEIPTHPAAKLSPARRPDLRASTVRSNGIEGEERYERIPATSPVPVAEAGFRSSAKASARTSARSAKMEREELETATPRLTSGRATQAELNFREMVARDFGYRNWAQLEARGSDAEAAKATQRVKILLTSTAIR